MQTIIPPAMTDEDVRSWFQRELPLDDFRGKKLLLIVPDSTRTAPMPLLFDAVYRRLRPVVDTFDVIIALGTHAPMSEQQICKLLGIEEKERHGIFFQTQFINHEWDNPEALTQIGTLKAEEIARISEGLLNEDIPVEINKIVMDYDVLLVLGPVFPHEVVGFSGGNKYFFPGIAGGELLNAFHWLAALISNVKIIGKKRTPVREVVDRAGQMIPRERRAIKFVVAPGTNQLHGLFYGSPEEAWRKAADVSEQVHIRKVPKPFHTVLSCAPPMYEEIWVAGKCMYKLEPVADGGELIIYAPHLNRVSTTHGHWIEQIGYHCKDYILKQPERFKDFPRGILAHSVHVRGGGTYENGVEKCRIKVTLASKLPPEKCAALNLGYKDPASVNIEDYANREDEGVLLVRKAGEQLHRLAE